MMGTEILNIDASWAQKFMKTESAILILVKCKYVVKLYFDSNHVIETIKS